MLSPGIDPHPVREATAERVRLAARELDFVPSPIARGLAARRSGLIGLLVPDLTDPHYPNIASGVEHAAREADMAVLISNTLGDTARLHEYLRVLAARRVDAIVLSGATSLAAEDVQALAATEVPVVLIGRPAAASATVVSVSVDNVMAARLATWHLAETGRQRIAHLAGPGSQTTMADRRLGYAQALQVAGLRARVVESNGWPEDGYTRMIEVFRHDAARPDAVFAATDRLAVAVLAAAVDAGVRVPDELAVLGFDDTPLAPHLRPSLSSVAQPAHELGRVAVKLARGLLAGEAVESVLLQASLVVRESTAPGQVQV